MTRLLTIISLLIFVHVTYGQTDSTKTDSLKNPAPAEGNTPLPLEGLVSDGPTNDQSAKDDLNDTTKAADFPGRLLKSNGGISPTADLRSIDGLFLGLVHKKNWKNDQDSVSGTHKISVLKSLFTKGIIAEYKGEWLAAIGKTDITVNMLADINGNILNFFGRGNDTFFDRTGDFRRFYRARFTFLQFEPALRFRLARNVTLGFGPAIHHFRFNEENNSDRFINTPFITNQYEALQANKTHGGLLMDFDLDSRNNRLLPSRGVRFYMRVQGFEGLSRYANAFGQAFPQFSLFKSLDGGNRVVLANRVGAGFTLGETAFYQSAFLGSQDNLLGYRKFRFAGDHLLYNNFETRVTFPNVLKRTLKGSVGILGFYDVGRVWIKNDHSGTIHHGYGGGVFLTPYNRVLLRAVAGFSTEGMQATVALRQRF
jgi:hypothetical protein